MTGATGIVTDPGFLDHDPGRDHPENIGRMIAVDRAVSCLNGSLVPIQGYSIDLKDLEGIHSPEYIRKILASASRKFTALTRDTFASNGSCHAARMAAGSCRKAVESVLTGQVRNAFALVRPPGHHAEFSRPMGYCLFNNMALAASFALNHFHLNRLLIVDWDVHHGNGTQHIFEADPRVLFFFRPSVRAFSRDGSCYRGWQRPWRRVHGECSAPGGMRKRGIRSGIPSSTCTGGRIVLAGNDSGFCRF